MRRVSNAVFVGLCLFLVAGTAGAGGLGARSAASPRLVSPSMGTRDLGVPALHWTSVRGADHYEVALSADPSFSSPIAAQGYTVGSISTRNTWATLTKLPPNGTYWWRVRAVLKSGSVSGWSASRSFRRAWTAPPRPLAPRTGATITYPKIVLELRWGAVPYAAKYRLALATDPGLGNLWSGQTVETEATRFVPPEALKSGTYYWAVTPVDAEGNSGMRSRVSSFRWSWPSKTAPGVGDLVAAAEAFDPLFTWRWIPGAVRYEVEISPSQDFAPGSKVCCDFPMIGNTFAPTSVLKNNRYYWRVRAIDADGNVGAWNDGPIFTKTFDNVPPVAEPSIKRFHVRDNWGDSRSSPPGVATASPILVWDKVPGASAYEVEVVPFIGGCVWTYGQPEHWTSLTATTAWTPLGYPGVATPYSTGRLVSKEIPRMVPGRAYCARVRALTDQDGTRTNVVGDYTYLEPAFTFTGFRAPGAVSMHAGDYLEPQTGTVERTMPLFTWKPTAAGYWVLVSKDPSFTTIVDFAYTEIPAYAPREDRRPTTYSDETTTYYWAVLPALSSKGDTIYGNPLAQSPSAFQKRSVPPAALLPKSGARVGGAPMFRWTPVDGARRYRLQVSAERSFGTLTDEISTASTSYTSTKIYAADIALWWRVRAEDENFVGLTWSTPRSFRNLLPAPVPSRANLTGGDDIPIWNWSPVSGAVSYDIHADKPNGQTEDLNGKRASALTPVIMTGTGIFHWKVRAIFAQSVGTVTGPYSRTMAYTRTISAPMHARTLGGSLLTWQSKAGVKQYQVQISATPDFGYADRVTTSATSFAPTFTTFLLGAKSRRLYWRVAAVDNGGNVGNFTKPGIFLAPASALH